MNLLLDTHMALWLLLDAPRLPAAVRAAPANRTNTVVFSISSIWEAVIKHALGKLPLPAPPAVFLPEARGPAPARVWAAPD